MKFTALFCLFLTFYSFNVYADFQDGGDAYKRGDFAAAAEEFIPLAKRGDHRAMFALGSMYAAGHGVEQDNKKAFDLFYEAALNGRIDAMYRLALMYEKGLGTTQDFRKALRYYQKSAKRGFPMSQYRFGLMYANGYGIKKNHINAQAWIIISAHYFVYESGQEKEKNSDPSSFQHKIELVREEEFKRITIEIIEKLDDMSKSLTDDDIEKIREKVEEYSRYKLQFHDESIRNTELNGSIDKLFLPDTLY